MFTGQDSVSASCPVKQSLRLHNGERIFKKPVQILIDTNFFLLISRGIFRVFYLTEYFTIPSADQVKKPKHHWIYCKNILAIEPIEPKQQLYWPYVLETYKEKYVRFFMQGWQKRVGRVSVRPPRFWQSRRHHRTAVVSRITTCPLRFLDLAPSLLWILAFYP